MIDEQLPNAMTRRGYAAGLFAVWHRWCHNAATRTLEGRTLRDCGIDPHDIGRTLGADVVRDPNLDQRS